MHRLLLAYSSEYFSRLLLSNFQEGRQTLIHLRFPDPANVFPLVLQVPPPCDLCPLGCLRS